jgi:RNA ligase (TIGR02306 family)
MGWWVVDSIDKYQVGDLVIYCEIDSWIPHEVAPFLSKGKEPREFGGIKGERLKTIKLKGQVSQGLLLPTSVLSIDNPILRLDYYIDAPVSDILGIKKWEKPIPAQLRGMVRGNFPSEIPKTDQERVQNISIEEYKDTTYEVTEKLHGSSMTCFIDNDGEFHVCSRNLDLKRDENNTFWKAAIKYDVEGKMRAAGLRGVALQGELCGEGLNGNNYSLGLEWFVFDVYVVGNGYMPPKQRGTLVNSLGLKHVPVVSVDSRLVQSVPELLEAANGKSYIAGCLREGFVYKSEDGQKSFKVISTEWLLKYD